MSFGLFLQHGTLLGRQGVFLVLLSLPLVTTAGPNQVNHQPDQDHADDDTDDDTGWMWGDVGTLYFWIREQDARAGDFSRVWMVFQCC